MRGLYFLAIIFAATIYYTAQLLGSIGTVITITGKALKKTAMPYFVVIGGNNNTCQILKTTESVVTCQLKYSDAGNLTVMVSS